MPHISPPTPSATNMQGCFSSTRCAPREDPELSTFIKRCFTLPEFPLREDGPGAPELWNQGGRREFDVYMGAIPPVVRAIVSDVLARKMRTRDVSAYLRGRFVYDVTFETPIMDKWSQNRAPIVQPKIKFRPSHDGRYVTLTIVKKSGSGQLPLTSKHSRQLFRLVCEICVDGVWQPWAVSQAVKIISKASCKSMRGDDDEGEPMKRIRVGSDDSDCGSYDSHRDFDTPEPPALSATPDSTMSPMSSLKMYPAVSPACTTTNGVVFYPAPIKADLDTSIAAYSLLDLSGAWGCTLY